MKATQQISTGDFTPIMPTRRFRDEFTNLAVALNNMAHQLHERQEIIIQSHKLRAVGTLTAGVAHELNNPINNIILTAAALKEDYGELSDREKLEMVDDLVEQAERAHRIVRNLLDYARKSEIVSETLRIEDLIHKTLELIQNQIKLQNIKLSTEIEPALPPLYGDRHYLVQVFLNILLNAIEAMPHGGNLDLIVKKADDPRFIRIQIADSGRGIPEHMLGSIFDPFFTTKATGKGTGLGLSVSLGIIRKHGGDIQVWSKVGKGTTFSITLPAHSTAAADLVQDYAT
jgi:signal transduction histidine kinase